MTDGGKGVKKFGTQPWRPTVKAHVNSVEFAIFFRLQLWSVTQSNKSND